MGGTWKKRKTKKEVGDVLGVVNPNDTFVTGLCEFRLNRKETTRVRRGG